MRERRGFTLLEMLLATVLIAGVVAVVYQMYIGSLEASGEGQKAMALCQTARVVLDRMADDLRAAVFTNGDFGFGLVGTDGGEENPAGDTLELSCPAAVPWRASSPESTSTPPPEADFRHITYRVITPEEAAEEADQENPAPPIGLVREVRTNLTSTDAEDRSVQVLSRRVVALELEYYDGAQWREAFEASAEERLPLAVRITITVVPEEIRPTEEPTAESSDLEEVYPGARTYSTVVALPCAAPPEGLRIASAR